MKNREHRKIAADAVRAGMGNFMVMEQLRVVNLGALINRRRGIRMGWVVKDTGSAFVFLPFAVTLLVWLRNSTFQHLFK